MVNRLRTLSLVVLFILAGCTTSTTKSPTTTVVSKSYQIGDVGPAGGTVFITPSTVGNTTGLYFELAPLASEVQLPWISSGNWEVFVLGASGTAVGDGAANTAAIARQAGNVAESSAAVYAIEYSVNGFSDWFLPSKDELDWMYANRASVGGFSTGFYWSSSEVGSNIALGRDFYDGIQEFNPKFVSLYVRPVRAFGAAAPTTTVDSKSDQIGKVGPAGGRIFITPSTPGNTTGLYFEVAPLASEVQLPWASSGNWEVFVLGASGTAIGDGAANTAAIARQAGNVAESSAAVYASEYSLNGFSDWFLPSADELDWMYANRASVGGFSTDYYWSSSEDDANGAWLQNLYSGDQHKPNKLNAFYVRPVRAFP